MVYVMGTRRRRRKLLAERQRRIPRAAEPLEAVAVVSKRAERLAYSREEAAQALGVSLATLDRRVVPAITTVSTEWGRRLIPAPELERYLAERSQRPRIPPPVERRRGRRPALPPEVVDRIRSAHASGESFGAIARELNREGIPTAQGGRQWWPSTIRAVLRREQA